VGIPVVLLNRKVDVDSVSSITGDNFVGGRRIATYLAAQKHERFAFVAGLEESSTSRDREIGFAEGLAMSGQSFERAVGNYSFEGSKLATRKLLASASPPDAIFYANDHMAIAGIEVARYEFGLKVGRDISVVGFDDVPCSSWSAFDLTTYSQPLGRMVDLVTETVLGALDRRAIAPVHAIVEGELVIRSSARRPQD